MTAWVVDIPSGGKPADYMAADRFLRFSRILG